MADNIATLVARLVADATGFKTGLDSAQRDLNTFKARAQATSRDASQAFRGITVAWTTMASALAGVGVTIGFGRLINDAKEFERQINVIRATSGATQAEMDRLTQSIRRAGLDFRVGARAAASAAQELQKSGISLMDISDGALESSIVLARALGADFASSASVAATAMQVFRADASRLDEVVQGVTGTVLGGRFELADYVLALQQAGGAAKAAGVEYEDFNAALLLVQRNIGSSGSDTGTALRTFISRLVPASDEAAEAMERLSLEFYDARGNFIGLERAAGEIQRAFKDLTDEARNRDMYTIFGVDAARVATALYNEGATGLARYRSEVQEAANAARIAEDRTLGFAGALEKLRAEWENFALTVQQNRALTQGTDALSGLVGDWELLVGLAGSGGFRQPAFKALSEEGQRRFNALPPEERRRTRAQYDDNYYRYALESMRPAELMRLLETQTGFDPDTGSFYQPLNETFLGRRLYDAAQLRRDAEADALWRRLVGTPPREITATPFDPPRPPVTPVSPGAPGGGTFDFGGGRDSLKDAMDSLLGGPDTIEAWAEELQKAFQDAAGEVELLGGPDTIEAWAEDLAGAFEELSRNKRVKDAADNFAGEVGGTLKDAFVNWDWDLQEMGDRLMAAWRETLWDVFIGDDMQKYMRQLAEQVKKLLNGMLGGAADGSASGGGWIESIINWGGKAFAGGFAEGGYIPPGQWGMTGEHGPEPVFGGRMGATVFPAASLAGAGAPVVNYSVSIDARGAQRGVGAEIEAAMQKVKAEAVAAAVTHVAKIQRARRSY